MSKKTIEQLEKEKGFVLSSLSVKDTKRVVTEEEFVEMALGSDHGSIGVNYEDRVQWLKDNGYKVNRKNLVDVNLPTKQVDEI